MYKIFLSLSIILCSMPLKSEVLKATESFFHIKLVKEVTQNPQQAYQQFLRVDEWWSSEHTWFGDSKNLSIDATAGGCFCENSDKGEVMHMTVSAVFPNAQIIMTGGLGPLQLMGLTGTMVWQFKPNETGGTTIVHEYRVNGGGQADLPKFAEIVNKVQALQIDLLAEKLAK